MSQFLASTGGDSFASLADEFDQPFNSEPPLGSFVEFVGLRAVTNTNSDPCELQHIA